MITGAMAREILVSKEGKAEGVSYVDFNKRRARISAFTPARAIVVAAQRLANRPVCLV